jgi:hypothetical protein
MSSPGAKVLVGWGMFLCLVAPLLNAACSDESVAVADNGGESDANLSPQDGAAGAAGAAGAPNVPTSGCDTAGMASPCAAEAP